MTQRPPYTIEQRRLDIASVRFGLTQPLSDVERRRVQGAFERLTAWYARSEDDTGRAPQEANGPAPFDAGPIPALPEGRDGPATVTSPPGPERQRLMRRP